MYMSISELSMMQLSDSFFPTGLFATSNGLEKLFLDKKITNVNELEKFNVTIIEHQVGPSDCVILANVIESHNLDKFDQIIKMDSLYSAMKSVKESREASMRSGIQLVKCIREFQCDKILNQYWQNIQNENLTGVYPVSFGVCCSALNIPKEKSLLMYLYGFVASIAGAALRLGMIDHFESQKMIHKLKPLVVKTAKESLTKSLDEIWQFSPQLEINQMAHEDMDLKMFVT